MYTRVFCQHCDMYYEVDLEEARLVEKFYSEKISFANNTYYFRNEKECFFNLVRELHKQTRQNEM
jgi:hypothetical protein